MKSRSPSPPTGPRGPRWYSPTATSTVTATAGRTCATRSARAGISPTSPQSPHNADTRRRQRARSCRLPPRGTAKRPYASRNAEKPAAGVPRVSVRDPAPLRACPLDLPAAHNDLSGRAASRMSAAHRPAHIGGSRVPVADGDHDARPRHRLVAHVWRAGRGAVPESGGRSLARSDLHGLLLRPDGQRGRSPGAGARRYGTVRPGAAVRAALAGRGDGDDDVAYLLPGFGILFCQVSAYR